VKLRFLKGVLAMPNAVASSAALGFPVAVSNTLGYIVGGSGVPDLPAWSL